MATGSFKVKVRERCASAPCTRSTAGGRPCNLHPAHDRAPVRLTHSPSYSSSSPLPRGPPPHCRRPRLALPQPGYEIDIYYPNDVVCASTPLTIGPSGTGACTELKDTTLKAAMGCTDKVSSCMYRYILRESCSQFDSLPLTSLTIFLIRMHRQVLRGSLPSGAGHSEQRVALHCRHRLPLRRHRRLCTSARLSAETRRSDDRSARSPPFRKPTKRRGGAAPASAPASPSTSERGTCVRMPSTKSCRPTSFYNMPRQVLETDKENPVTRAGRVPA